MGMENTNTAAAAKADLTFKQLIEEDKNLAVGQKVKVYWGFGSGFHAESRGVITKIFKNSVRVELTEDAYIGAYLPKENKEDGFPVSWAKGFELKGIPRCCCILGNQWRWWKTPEGTYEVRCGVKLIEE